MDYYKAVFDEQVGRGGRSGVGRIYIGSPYQKGHGGIGSFLAGLFRTVLPLLSRGAKAVGKEALRTGANIMSDIASSSEPVKEVVQRRFKESGENLKRKAEENVEKLMGGFGYNDIRLSSVSQLLDRSRSRNVKKRRKKARGSEVRKISQKRVKKKKSGKLKKSVKKRRSVKKRKQKKIVKSSRDIFK